MSGLKKASINRRTEEEEGSTHFHFSAAAEAPGGGEKMKQLPVSAQINKNKSFISFWLLFFFSSSAGTYWMLMMMLMVEFGPWFFSSGPRQAPSINTVQPVFCFFTRVFVTLSSFPSSVSSLPLPTGGAPSDLIN